MDDTTKMRASAHPPQQLARPIAFIVWALAAGLPALVGVSLALMPQDTPDSWALPVFMLVGASWGIVGAIIATRQSRNVVGWELWVVGTFTAANLLGQGWALASLLFFSRSLPFADWALWLMIPFNAMLGVAFLLMPLRFPDGRLASPRWRVVEAVTLLAIACTFVGGAVQPGPLSAGGPANPTGIDGLGEAGQTAVTAGTVAFLGLVPLVVASLIVRFRRGTRIERQQLKWFAGAVAIAGASITVATVVPSFGVVAFAAFGISLALIPIAIGVAVLRYRLFEIDRLVGRTVSYAVVTALLAGAFLATNLGLQALLADATGSSTLITAVSTLVVAALFQPLRRRVQTAVDRRFNRARVDGERVVGAFAVQARDQVDLDRLREVTLRAAADAVDPAGASLWLRGAS